MSYMLLIHERVGQRQERTQQEGEALFGSMLEFAAELQRQGVLRGVESLQSQDERAARVQVRGGKASVLDGPFAEAKEMVGGFFLIDVPTRAQAIEVAQQCPAAQWATVEVREVGPCFI